MARSFAGINTMSLQVAASPKRLWSQSSNTYPPTSLTVTIDWTAPFALSGNAASLGVLINLLSQARSSAQPLDQIKSVYVDNTGSSVPIYVVFPSTGFTVTAAPGTADWYPVLTTDFIVEVFGIGFTAGSIPLTNLFFANIIMQPYSDAEINQSIAQWLASSTISRGTTIYNTNFGVPALGDQYINFNITQPLLNAGGTQNIFNFGSGFIYMTDISFDAFTLAPDNTSGSTESLIFESTGVAGSFLSFLFGTGIANQPTIIGNITKKQGNFKIDGTQTWRLRWSLSTGANWRAGSIMFSCAFTTNPN